MTARLVFCAGLLWAIGFTMFALGAVAYTPWRQEIEDQPGAHASLSRWLLVCFQLLAIAGPGYIAAYFARRAWRAAKPQAGFDVLPAAAEPREQR